MKRRVAGTLLLVLLSGSLVAAGCSSTASERPYRSGDDPPQSATATPAPRAGRPSGEADAPEISRSVGAEGGIVLLWPRIVGERARRSQPDAETRALASRLQARLRELVGRALPNRPIDVRPEPERVCPRSGCKGASVGVLLARAGGGGCAAVALVSGPGPSSARLVPWIGQIDLTANVVPFRSPPESAVQVQDYVRCAKLFDDRSRDAEVEAAIAGQK